MRWWALEERMRMRLLSFLRGRLCAPRPLKPAPARFINPPRGAQSTSLPANYQHDLPAKERESERERKRERERERERDREGQEIKEHKQTRGCVGVQQEVILAERVSVRVCVCV